MAVSITHLSKYLSGLSPCSSIWFTWYEVKALSWHGNRLPWNGLSCLSVVCYVLKFCSVTDHSDVFRTIIGLNDLADSASPQYADREGPIKLDGERCFADVFANNFMPKVQEFFTLQKGNEDLTGLIHFLIEILGSELFQDPTFIQPLIPEPELSQEEMSTFIQPLIPEPELSQEEMRIAGDKCGTGQSATPPEETGLSVYMPPNNPRVERYDPLRSIASLQKDLTFLLAVLGDVPFQFIEIEEVDKNLLAEFEAVANEAGSFIYSHVFCTSAVNVIKFCNSISVLSRTVNFLILKIKDHCIKLLELPLFIRPIHPRNIDAPDSFFIVDSLLDDIENFTTSRVDLTDDVKFEIGTLSEAVTSAQSFLNDINASRETDIHELKEFVVRVRDSAYEAEYLMNSFLVRDFPIWYFSLRLPMIIQKFKLIRERVKEIRTVSGTKVVKIKEDFPVDVPSLAMEPTPAAINANVLVGFEDERIQILNELTQTSDNLQIISIDGMPGIGKTSLARKLYNERLVADHFDVRAWCVVSQIYQKRKVLVELVMSLRSIDDRDEILRLTDESLSLKIYQTLKGKRYLIVLDDVWDSGVWGHLKSYFPDEKKGSRILSTTRLRETSPDNSIIHRLPFLSEDECWELLQKKVFVNETCPPQLRDSGKRIAKKCGGLPLVVVVIAGVLANMDKGQSEWEKVEESLETFTGSYMKMLELSYNHLPNHLKLCFLYLGVFPEDTEIDVRKLMRLWIVEGFIRKDEKKSQSNVAEGYLIDLINRNFVLVTRYRSTGGVKTCNIHDLLREMCLGRAKEENFLNLIANDKSSTYKKHQRLSVLSTAPAHLRPSSLHCHSYFAYLSDPSSCFPQMKHLKVMELSLHKSMELSLRRSMLGSHVFKGIELLVRLRYLVINGVVPELILHNLINLEVLRIDSNVYIVDVSTIIQKVVKLRHLHIKKRARFVNDFNGSQPNKLEFLSVINIRSTNDHKYLRSLPHLQKLKCFCPTSLLDFSFLTQITSLRIHSPYFDKELPRDNIVMDFPLGIKKLTLVGTVLPWERMCVLGRLPELKALKLLKGAFEGGEWETTDDEFQKLRFLKLEMLEIEQWVTSSEHFPLLRHLVLVKCNKLQSIPTDLGDIPTLDMIEVHECSFDASLSAIEIEQEQRDNGNEKLRAIITTPRWTREQLLFMYKQKEEELSTGSPRTFSTGEVKESFHISHSSEREGLHRWDGRSTIHHGITCDYCGTNPIVGDRYKCKDCMEEAGYDLCKDCYSSERSNLPGRNNQNHTSEHEFEIITSKIHSVTK